MGYTLASSQYTGAQGISSSTSATTLTDSTAAFTVNAFSGFLAQSTSAGFPTRGKVSSNTATVLTVASWDAGTPDSGKPYVVSNLQQIIGDLYHVGFTNGSQWYGYMLESDPAKGAGFHERSDVAAKESLIQYSSPNIIDRDLTYWPKISQGDFSGGMLQAVGIDPAKYWDATLNVSQPGYLASFAQWKTTTIVASLGAGAAVGSEVMVGYATDGVSAYTVSFTENNFHVYFVSASGTVNATITLDIVAKALSHDSQFLYVTDGAKIEQRSGGSLATNTLVVNAATVTAKQIWAITQGTGGRYLFYSDLAAPSSLYRIDLTALPSAGAQVPLGTMTNPIMDLCPFQNGVAILTSNTSNNTTIPGWEVWFFDGANTTPIFRSADRYAVGICNALGNLYVTDRVGSSGYGELRLTQIASGSSSVVVRLSTPTAVAINLPNITAPFSSGTKVYFAVNNSPVQSLNANYFVIYDTVSGATYHTADNSLGVSSVHLALRSFAVTNDLIAHVRSQSAGSAGSLAFQNAGISGGTFDSGGKLVTSRLDFNTPGIEKRFRRLEVIHAPIPANCSIKIDCYIDKDPVAYVVGLTPDATITNSKAGSQATDFFLANLIGHSAYFVITFTSSDNVSTMVLNWYSVEITTPLAWEMTLACTATRNNLNQDLDTQGVKGKDLADFWRDAWENPRRLTMFLRDGFAYTVTMESFDRWNPSPIKPKDGQVNDEEYFVKIVVRQTLADN